MTEGGSDEPNRPRIRLHRARFAGEPLLDTAVSHAMLRRVASGAVSESLRLYVPDDALLFSSLDARRPGYAEAVAFAEGAGFPAVIRLAGGQAAAFLEESIAFAWAIPDADARLHIHGHFEQLSTWIAESLRQLGLDARVGPVEGEYCPGEFSVNLEGRVKVMGVGQRVIRGGAHMGGVLTLGGSDRLRAVLGPVYERLGFGFQPETAGGIQDFDPGLGVEDVLGSMLRMLAARGYVLDAVNFDAAIREEAEALRPIHASENRPDLSTVLRTSRREGKVLSLNEPMPDTHEGRDGEDS